MYLPNSKWTWSFAGIALGQALVALALEAYVFGRFAHNVDDDAWHDRTRSGARTIPTYLALFIFGFIYELILVYDALRMKNTIQVIGICIYNFGMLIYASVCVNQVSEAVYNLSGEIDPGTWPELRPFLIAAPCIIALGTVLLSFVAWKLYAEFAWSIYKDISADLRLKRRFLAYQIYIALLKFDFFFFLGFTVQFMVVVPRIPDAEYGLTIAAIPITIVLLILAAYFTRRESYLGQFGIIFVYFAAMAYFIFKLVRMYDSPRAADYQQVRPSLTTFAILTLLLLVITIAAAIVCMRNFDKGLKPHLERRRLIGRNHEAKYGGDPYGGPNQHQLGRVPTRMTID